MANKIWEKEIKLNITGKDLQEDEIVNYNTEMRYSQLVKEIKGKQAVDPNYLFTDVHFPPAQTSLVYSEQWRDHMPSNLTWKRTAHIVREPTFLKDGFSREDVVQGALGNCYFLSAASALANRPKAMRTVVPSDQVSLSNKKYLGAYHFRFWQFGTWYDVVVDDWLPCLPDEGVAFSYSKDNNEFWISLLEKAYGKLYGSYEALIRGHTIDALVDLTGGVAVKYELRKPHSNLSVQMRKAVRNGSIVCLGKAGNTTRYDYDTGLQSLHSYSVTLAERIKDNKDKVDLYRVRNPWGMVEYEWTLDWSDHSEKWDLVSSEDKKRLQYPAGDGEWYMSYDDIIKNFDNVTICTIGPDFDEDGVQTTKGYYYSYAQGSWITSVNSGGGFVNNSLQNFLCNPQYLIKASTSVPGSQCSLFIGLMQRYSRQQQEGRKQFIIGYRLYKVDDSLGQYLQETKQKIPFSYHYQLILLSACDEGRKMREVSTYYEVEGGKYYLYIPFTKHIGDKEDYLLRVYSEEPVEIDELN